MYYVLGDMPDLWIVSFCSLQGIFRQTLLEDTPWRREWQPKPVFLPGESPLTEELAGLQAGRVRKIDVTV